MSNGYVIIKGLFTQSPNHPDSIYLHLVFLGFSWLFFEVGYNSFN